MSWIDCGNYFLSTAAQRTDLWKQHREGRITASNAGSTRNHSPYMTAEEFRDQILHIREKNRSNEEKERMNKGVIFEDVARKWYEKEYKIKVEEVGLAVPKWDLYLGASPDGLVGEDGIIEIKCTKYLYPQLESRKDGSLAHIFPQWIDQIMMEMSIFRRQWTDLVIYAYDDKEAFLQRIYFDEKYWRRLYNDIKIFLNHQILPYLKERGIKVVDPRGGFII